MKRLLRLLLWTAATLAPALAQVSNVSPQSVTLSSTALNLNAATSPTVSPCITNVGQTVHFVFYQATGATGAPTNVQIRIEGSFNSDSATCTTGTWFSISDDGTEPAQNGTNMVLGIGAFPFVRINLVTCSCSALSSITANYSGTSAIPGNPFGLYGAGQQIRKLVFSNTSQSGTPATIFASPYGSVAGVVAINAGGAFTAGTLQVSCLDLNTVLNYATKTLTGLNALVLPVPPTSCNTIRVRCNACTGPGVFSASYFLFPPGSALPSGIQPSGTNNSEATAVNATASVALTPQVFQRSHLFSVSGRCSAGTAQITVVDTTSSTNLWTSGATEVTTTTFKFQWNPALAGAPGDTITVSLTTCGAANTGTLDVQASVM